MREWLRQAEADAGRGSSGALTTVEREDVQLGVEMAAIFRQYKQRYGSLPTAEGWLYLAMLLDLFSRKEALARETGAHLAGPAAERLDTFADPEVRRSWIEEKGWRSAWTL